MTNIKIVIGANFGDEGKGLMTDYFAHNAQQDHESCIVVLHNGGAQRGHTVATDNRVRHVFHHFGSGTFCGADTYCSKEFIINPMVFSQEFEELKTLGYDPTIYIHPLCKISTPFDMILNQIIEEHRSGSRHGSCGMGIYETLLRSKEDKYSICFEELFLLTDIQIRNRLQRIRDEWMQVRCKSENIGCISSEWADIINNPSLIDHFMIDLKFMVEVSIKVNDSILSFYQNVIFENGQGLLLDQNNMEYFPHLTPSNTGIKNPLSIIENVFNKQNVCIEACYVSRTYLTRHGAGRLDNECTKEDINKDMFDHTNIPNPFQGTLRYGYLDIHSLFKRISNDYSLLESRNYNESICSLALTHTNEYYDSNVCEYYSKFDHVYSSCTENRNCVRRKYKFNMR